MQRARLRGFCLLRHGQTELSLQRRYSGRGNPALTETGRAQADAAAQYIGAKSGISAVLTSPLERAYDTAARSAKVLGLDVTVDDDLIETDFGAWEGLTFSEAAERDPKLHRRWLRDTTVAPPDGESFDSVAERVRRFQARAIAEHPAEPCWWCRMSRRSRRCCASLWTQAPEFSTGCIWISPRCPIAEFYPDGVASVRLVNQTAYL